MRLIIQNTKESVRIREVWPDSGNQNEEDAQAHKKDCGKVIILAELFLMHFPRFKELILNTEITEDI